MTKAILIFFFAGHITTTHVVESGLAYDAMEVCEMRGADAVEVVNRDMHSTKASYSCSPVSP